jgi:hypothetical protein
MLLARGQSSGLTLVGTTAACAARSFRAAAICLPALLVLRLLGWSDGRTPAGGWLLALSVEAIGFVVAWAGFALASLVAAEAAGRRARWPVFIAAWNYTNVVQYGVLLAATMMPMVLGLPGVVMQTLGLVTLGYVFWLEWFVTRAALGVAPAHAVGFVLMDLLIGVFVAGLVSRLSQGG